jgi:hypothetical protein
MENIADKSDNTGGSSGELPASQYNDHKNEIQGAVEASGQILSAATLLQLAKALFINGVGAQSCIDSSSGDTIQLSPLTGGSGLRVPDNYAELNGAILRFVKSTPNVTTAVTINFGQTGTELAAKTLVRSDGTVPEIGDVDGECYVQWDNSADKWVLLSNGADAFKYPAVDTDTIIPKFKTNNVIIDTGSGDATITLDPGDFEGQTVNVIVDDLGMGIVNWGGSYLIYITLNSALATSLIATFKWINGAWVVSGGVTADYVSGTEIVKLSSNGRMELRKTASITFTAVSGASHTWGFTKQFKDSTFYCDSGAVATIVTAILCFGRNRSTTQVIFSYTTNDGSVRTGSTGTIDIAEGEY